MAARVCTCQAMTCPECHIALRFIVEQRAREMDMPPAVFMKQFVVELRMILAALALRTDNDCLFPSTDAGKTLQLHQVAFYPAEHKQ